MSEKNRKESGTNSRKDKSPGAGRKNPKEKLTAKYWLIGAAAVVVVIAIIAVASLIAADMSRLRFSSSNGMLTNLSDGRVYVRSSGNYEARYAVDEPYGYIDTDDSPIYKVGYYNSYGVFMEVDPELCLTDGAGTLYYSSSMRLPSLSGFDWDIVYVCNDEDDEFTFSIMSLTDEDGRYASDFVESYLRGRTYSYEEDGGLPDETYKIRITSTVYPYLYYVMTLVRCDNGDFYAYTDEDRTSIAVDSSLFENLVPGSSDTEEQEDEDDEPSGTESGGEDSEPSAGETTAPEAGE